MDSNISGLLHSDFLPSIRRPSDQKITTPSLRPSHPPQSTRSPSYPFRLSSSFREDQHLKPRPKLSSFHPPDINHPEDAAPPPSSHASLTCAKIEKLVLVKCYGEALELFYFLCAWRAGAFSHDALPSSTYDSLVTACIGLRSVRGVKSVFRHMVDSGFELDRYMRNRVLLMYVKCGMMVDALALFDGMPERNEVSWSTIISGLVDAGRHREALQMFSLMCWERSDSGSRTMAKVLRACGGLESVSIGRQLHACLMKLDMDEDVFLSCALVSMYSKCGCIEEAQWAFEEMPKKTVVGWNTIIGGYALNGYTEEALDLYHQMRSCGVAMDNVTYTLLFRICVRLASLVHGKQFHASLVRNGFGEDVVANTTLVDLYGKWGSMEDARDVFDKMPYKTVITWNALIAGYGNHGMGKEAIEMFEKMIEEKMVPDHFSFLAVLSACSYSGLSNKGWKLFVKMTDEYNIKPRAMHYSRIIELLGREGLLDEALYLIKEAPFTPTAYMWGALLTACRIHGDVELGMLAAKKLVDMGAAKIGNYLVLLNAYTSIGRLDEATKVIEIMTKRRVRIQPACTWIKINKQSHTFCFGDTSHPQSKEIHVEVDRLIKIAQQLGYVPNQRCLLPDVLEREEQLKKYHSEMLAIAFGLISTCKSSPLQVVQSHRMCDDCHRFVKLIMLVKGREMVVRDSSRFHHFKHGNCSCGDYW